MPEGTAIMTYSMRKVLTMGPHRAGILQLFRRDTLSIQFVTFQMMDSLNNLIFRNTEINEMEFRESELRFGQHLAPSLVNQTVFCEHACTSERRQCNSQYK